MKKDLIKTVREELKRRNAILLAHNYQIAEVQDAADLTGDSLGLSIQASKTKADIIVFCGVHFMAESAAILSPKKRVLLPRMDAGCPMADMIDADTLKAKKDEHPDATVVTYVNSSAEVKALSDICCTSANAVNVVKKLKAKKILFTPDQNLAAWTAAHVQNKEIIPWKGFCPTHNKLRAEMVKKAMAEHPEAELVVHPECRPEVTALAHAVKSTSGMLTYAGESNADVFLIGTEIGMLHPLRRARPDIELIPLAPEVQICGNMKLTTLEDVAASLRDLERHTIAVPEAIRVRAKKSLDRMLAIPAQ